MLKLILKIITFIELQKQYYIYFIIIFNYYLYQLIIKKIFNLFYNWVIYFNILKKRKL